MMTSPLQLCFVIAHGAGHQNVKQQQLVDGTAMQR
jgi:hypothetical protein